MTKNTMINAIENGYVIDHIPAGRAVFIIQVLHLIQPDSQLIIGLNLDSKKWGRKDLIKIKNLQLTEADFANVTIFAPGAHINRIENFQVTKKFTAELPETIRDIVKCINPNCITCNEPTQSIFYVVRHPRQTKLRCHYCERTYHYEELITQTL